MDQTRVQKFVAEQGCGWIFNPPFWRRMGAADWNCTTRTGRNFTGDWTRVAGAGITGNVNSRPISAVPSDIHEPQPLTPAMQLTMKTRPLARHPGNFVPQDLYARKWWKRAQYLADQFWIRWKR